MSERSVEIAKQSISGSNKYDYFVVGIGAATFGYFAKDYEAVGEVGINENSLIVISLFLLAISVVSGLKKIERHNKFLEKNGKYLDLAEHLAGYSRNVIEGGVAINEESGEILNPSDSALKAAALKRWLPSLKLELERSGNIIGWYSIFRDYSLFLAYCTLVFSKLLPFFYS